MKERNQRNNIDLHNTERNQNKAEDFPTAALITGVIIMGLIGIGGLSCESRGDTFNAPGFNSSMNYHK